MSFRFALDEPIDRGFRRIALEQIGRAATTLQRDRDDPKAVHEVRKHLKRVRALLRLVRSGIGNEAFRAENHRLRDIGRLLAGARERHVMLQTLLALESRDGVEARAIAAVRPHVEAAIAETGEISTEDAVAEASRRLSRAGRAIKRLQFNAEGFGVIAVGLETGMRNLRRSHAAANTGDASDEIFHEWRKAVQHHWRQMALLSAAWPAYMGARARLARELSQLVGEDHDLAVLAAFVAALQDVDRRSARTIRKACRIRQAALRGHAEPLGQRLAAEGPSGFARRTALYWDTARRSERTALADDNEALGHDEPPTKPNGPAGRARASATGSRRSVRSSRT